MRRTKLVVLGIIPMLLMLQFMAPLNTARAEVGGDTVMLGVDKYFYNADVGDAGKSSWGWVPMYWGSNHYEPEPKATAAVVVGPAGWGGGEAWAWVGKDFVVQGSGTDYAVIRMSGHIYGAVTAGGGVSEAWIELLVKDKTTGDEWSTFIFHEYLSGYGSVPVDEDYSKSITVNLTGGHEYLVYLRVKCNAYITLWGEAGADFGPENGDAGYTNYSQIFIDF